jgi:S-adenosylmethionine hydrolase
MAELITLTTDFGTQDSYVAEMKGVLLSEGPASLRIVDLSHELPPFDVANTAHFVRATLPRFPAGTVHVVVVDPGVGSSRRPLAAEVGGQLVVGPDNGVFAYVFDRNTIVHAIDVERLARPISATFHGRDVFAPVAARLSRGVPLAHIGPRIDSYQHLPFPMVEIQASTLTGRIIRIDRYGNLITNIPRSTLVGFLAGAPPGSVEVQVAERVVRGVLDHYAEAKLGDLLAVIGSAELLEVAVREGNAAHKLGAQIGASVRLSLRAPP